MKTAEEYYYTKAWGIPGWDRKTHTQFAKSEMFDFAESYHQAMMEDPYFYFPQCDVEGCEGVSCSGGNAWRDTGYWSVCPKHAQEFRDGKPQPAMKESAIAREKIRVHK